VLFRSHAPYNATVDSIFGRRTDATSRPRAELSPRLGFIWTLSESGTNRLRGGVGVFSVRPPVAWPHASRYSYGSGIVALSCGQRQTDLGPPPPFTTDYRAPPLACANAATLTTARQGAVDLLAPDLGMARTLRGALGYDRQLPWDFTGSFEGLFTRNLTDFAFVNLNLTGPQGLDRNGRVLYGTIGSGGVASPALRSSFSEVIDLQEVSRNHAMQLSARLERRFGGTMTAMAYYTFARVRDAQTPLRVNTSGTDNWASRAVSGREDDLRPGVSLNDIPHRVVVAGTKRGPWRRWPTEVSFYYVGESGSPFTYVAYGTGRRGDLNADGSSTNDPIYVPRSALDTSEIHFAALVLQTRGADGVPRVDTISAARQAQAFDQFIGSAPCLRRQRGRILMRNSCREPWSTTTIASVRQGIPMGRRGMELQVDIYNVLNLLRRDWGQTRVAAPALLEQVDESSGPASTAQPIFHFPLTRPQWTALPAASVFQLQLALRYSF